MPASLLNVTQATSSSQTFLFSAVHFKEHSDFTLLSHFNVISSECSIPPCRVCSFRNYFSAPSLGQIELEVDNGPALVIFNSGEQTTFELG